jgi:type I restriction enzyme S subunit
MASDWNTYTLSEICSVIKRGISPKYTEVGGALVLNQKCIRDQRVSLLQARRNDTEKKKIPEDRLLQLGDVLINSTGVGTLGRVAQLNGITEPTTVDSHVTIARPCDPRVDIDFFGWAVKFLQPQIESLGEGSTGQTELSRHRIGELVLNAPDSLPEQKAIAHILSSLDDKITLNRKMNATLEAMAQALFKSWFVDFDPVIDNALAAGNPIPETLAARAEARRQALANGTANRKAAQCFPDSFQETEELGWIPEGWEVKILGEVTTELRRGISPKYTEDEGVRVINQRCIRDHAIMFSNARRNDTTKKKVDGRLLQPGDVLINSTGVGTLGRIAQVLSLDEPTVMDSHVTVARPDQSHYKPYTFGRMMISLESQIEAMGHGSTGQTELSRADLSVMPVILPSGSTQELAENLLSEWATKAGQNSTQSTTLTKLRDTLLPKLISGELRVSEAEQLTEEALV